MAEQTQAVATRVLVVTSSPHLKDASTTRQIMYEVIIGLAPAAAYALWLFRGRGLAVLASCVATCVATEWVFNRVRGKSQTISDGSAAITGLILGLSLPPTFPWWGGAVGGVVAIGIAKMLYGGLGANVFNPAMVGRAFLMACFGTLMTAWTLPIPLERKLEQQQAEVQAAAGAEVDAVTGETALAAAKRVMKDAANPEKPAAERRNVQELNAQVSSMFVGKESGSLGETSALLWLIGGLFLLVRRTITWHIPATVLGSAGLIATTAWLLRPEVYPNPLVHLFGGALMMGAFFIATDLVTSPLTKRGRLIFGSGVGALVMLIRLKGGYPEGVMYAVLLMNCVTPLLDRWTRPTPLGGHEQKG